MFIATAPLPFAPLRSRTGEATPRAGALAATRLADGRVYVLGQEGQEVLFDPVLGTFESTQLVGTKSPSRMSVLLGDGRVLVVSATYDRSEPAVWAEVVDPSSPALQKTVGATDPLRDIWSGVLLNDGTVLFTGGWEFEGGSDCDNGRPIASAEIFDPRTETFTEVGPMTTPRFGATTTLLADGRVLVAGGLLGPRSKCGPTLKVDPGAELYDPSTRSFAPTGSMAAARAGHAAVPLSDGSVLVVGGDWTAADYEAEPFRYPPAEIYR